MLPEIVNSAGLVSNIAGVALAFFYGYPQPSHEEGVGLSLEKATYLEHLGKTVEQLEADTRKQKSRYRFWSRVGLALMAIGFVLQLIATWIARST